MNIDFLFNISESQKHFVSGSFCVIMYMEVINMNTAEIVIVILGVVMFGIFIFAMLKAGGTDK